MSEEFQFYIFVYGTLRKDGMYASLLAEAEFIGYDKVAGFIMRDLADYPMIFERDDPALKIAIEIYKIDNTILQQLDKLEEYSENDKNSLYIRKAVSSLSGMTGFIYYGQDENKYQSYDIIPGGDWMKK